MMQEENKHIGEDQSEKALSGIILFLFVWAIIIFGFAGIAIGLLFAIQDKL